MSFLKVGKAPSSKQRLYILDIELPSGMKLVKIGKASGPSAKERMLQINGSIFDKFRCTAKISIKRDREVSSEEVFKMETTLHQYFSTYQYNTPHKWSGCTEAFTIPLADAVMAFEAVIDGQVPDSKYELPGTPMDDDLPF